MYFFWPSSLQVVERPRCLLAVSVPDDARAHTSNANALSFGARLRGPETALCFCFLSFLPPFTRLLNNPTFRRLSRMTSGRHICLARHQSESRGWNRSVAFARDNGDDSNKHMASRAARPPFTEEDACEEPVGPTSLCTPHTFHAAEDFFFSLAHPVPFFSPPAVFGTRLFVLLNFGGGLSGWLS